MSCTQVPSSTLTRPYLNNLLHILRSANQRYSQLAASLRQSLRPTHHARKRAAALKLRVSIDDALKLDYRHVSTVPLAVLDITASPAPARPQAQRAALPSRRPALVLHAAPVQTVQIVAPIPVRAEAQHVEVVLGSPADISAKVVGREREMKRLSRPVPALRCAMPQNPPIDMLAFNVTVTIEAPESAAQDKSHWSSSESGEDSGSEEERSAWYSSDPEDAASKDNFGRVDFTALEASKNSPPQLDMPAEVNSRFSWRSDMFSGSSSGALTSSTSGPVTPPESCQDMSKHMIRIKRKPSTSFTDSDDETIFSEKRPKYERKEWTQHSTRKTFHRPTSSRVFSSSPARR